MMCFFFFFQMCFFFFFFFFFSDKHLNYGTKKQRIQTEQQGVQYLPSLYRNDVFVPLQWLCFGGSFVHIELLSMKVDTYCTNALHIKSLPMLSWQVSM